MYVIQARNVNDALAKGKRLIEAHGVEKPSRYGPTVEADHPVTTVYAKPRERVLFDARRDANPFFHFMESLWILAGRDDVEWLAQFNARMREFSDDGTTFHGAYGKRLRDMPDRCGEDGDQIRQAIDALTLNPDDRRVVLQIWNSDLDLGTQSKDIPCNDLIMLKVRNNRLHMTVCCRSNDMIWGAYGANAVQFSMIQEYIADRIGAFVGTYYQVSDSFHVYEATADKIGHIAGPGVCPYGTGKVSPYPLDANHPAWDHDLHCFMDEDHLSLCTPFFQFVAVPLFQSWKAYKNKQPNAARQFAALCRASDWGLACGEWLERRYGA